MSIPYEELEKNTIYWGELPNGKKYYFKYLGNNQWTAGSNFQTNISNLWNPFPLNTDKVIPIEKAIPNQPASTATNINKKMTEYKVINHISKEPLYRCIQN